MSPCQCARCQAVPGRRPTSAMPSGCSGSSLGSACQLRPKGQIAELRAYVRQRERLLEYAASHIQHMQKALTEMNSSSTTSSPTSLADRPADIRAICGGAPRCCACAITVATPALRQLRRRSPGYRTEHLCARQALALYEFTTRRCATCGSKPCEGLSIDRGHSRMCRRHVGVPIKRRASLDVRAALSRCLERTSPRSTASSLSLVEADR